MSNSNDFDRGQQMLDEQVHAQTNKLKEDKTEEHRLVLEIPRLNSEVAELKKQLQEKTKLLADDNHDLPLLRSEIHKLESDLRNMTQKLEQAHRSHTEQLHSAGVKDVKRY